MKYSLGLKRSPYDCRDYKYEKLLKVAYVLPETLDLRDKMFGVKDQGNYGTCSAMTASQMKEWQEINDINIKELLSPQFVYNLRNNYPEEGMEPRDTMQILKNTGIVEENLYPYAESQLQDIPDKLILRAGMYRCAGYASIETIEGLKQSLIENGVCYLGVPVYNFGLRMWKQNPGEYFLGGHAMTVVGYKPSGFILRNSWGKGWGDA